MDEKEQVGQVTNQGTAKESQDTQDADYDGAWKDLIQSLWPQFIKRTIPALYAELDLSRPPEFLSQELRDPLPIAKGHKAALYVDELLKLYLKEGALLRFYLKNGDQKIVYLHTEIQGPGGEDIGFRMFTYAALIHSHYGQIPIPLAILTSKRPENERERIGEYKVSYYGQDVLTYKYFHVEVYDLDDDELLNSGSPIDIVFYAAKKAGTRPAEIQKLSYLRTLTRLLLEKGWTDEERQKIYLFVTRVINLKDELLEKEYLDEMEAQKEKKDMKTFIDKYYEEKNRKESARVAESSMRANGVAPEVISRVTAAILTGVVVPA